MYHSDAMADTVLDIRALRTVFHTREGLAVAVNDVSFALQRGEILGLVGESGCGKTVTALSIMRLVRPPGEIVSGDVLFNGRNLRSIGESEMRDLRGNRIAMAFQEPMTALNPVYTIASQMTEVYRRHLKCSSADARGRSVDMLRHVGIPDPEFLIDAFPHELSGGMRQRVLIAMSLACRPDVLIADEPTTAIDVTVQAQLMQLLRQLRDEYGMAVLLISHDLGVVASVCDRVAIMYASNIVETAPTRELYARPRHPYTRGLLQSIPAVHQPRERLSIIPGQVPRPTHYPPGCNFAARCPRASERCNLHEPALEETRAQHLVACWNMEA